MDASEQLKQDVREGRIDVDRLVDLIVTSQRQLQAANQQLQAANLRIAELEKQLGGPTDASTTKLAQPFSLRAEEQREKGRGKKKKRQKKTKGRRGRITTAEKIARAERHEDVVPEGLAKGNCQESHVRPVWRLENGRGVLVAYHIYRGPNNRYGKIPGVIGRSEFGIEFSIEIAHLIFVMGLSFDKVAELLKFFQGLQLRKSQIDALLHRLARHWQKEFDVLCTLLANSLVVHADETSWSINSVWAFLSEKARLLFFGVHKDADTLKLILDPATFAGTMISDDAAVYGQFSKLQRCWAHLLRKAIKLTLQDPDNEAYRAFTDKLLAIYREACRIQRDGRLSDAGRARKVKALDDEVLELCGAMWAAELPPLEDEVADDYRKLANEVMRLMLAQELFVFVTTPPAEQPNGHSQAVSGTNNEGERTLRNPAQARDTGRTSKTPVGARRRTILHSVLESLRLYLPCFTLTSVLAEVTRWLHQGQSCFSKLLHEIHEKTEKLDPTPKQPSSTPSSTQPCLLDQLFPSPSG